MTAEEPGVEAPLRTDRERAESVPGGGREITMMKGRNRGMK